MRSLPRSSSDGVTAAELERAKRRLRADAIYALDSQSRLARTFGTALTNGRSIRDVLEWPSGIAAVTAEEVKEVARAILQPQRSVTGIITPLAKSD